jgi:acetyltransferase-like isoleucine patch superfamily enzyme
MQICKKYGWQKPDDTDANSTNSQLNALANQAHIDRFGINPYQNPSDEVLFTRVSIGRDCWSGEGAIIMADLGERCIVGAGSVVHRPMPENRLISGNSARIIKEIPPAPANQR